MADKMGKKILIIDDDQELLKMLQTYFEMKGYRISTARDGVQGLKMAEENPGKRPALRGRRLYPEAFQFKGTGGQDHRPFNKRRVP